MVRRLPCASADTRGVMEGGSGSAFEIDVKSAFAYSVVKNIEPWFVADR